MHRTTRLTIDGTRKRLLLVVASLLAACAQTVPFQPGEKERMRSANDGGPACSFKHKGLPPDTVVVAAGMYSGRPLGIHIDKSGHEATTFDVAVHADRPVALVLGAYEPTVWNIGWSRGTRIVAVYATGYHRQAVAGLPAGTPVIATSYTTDGPCGSHYFGSGAANDWVDPLAQAVFGRPVARVYDRAPERIFDIVLSAELKRPYETSTATSVMSFREPGTALAGQVALQDAVKRGFLRRATLDDAESLRTWLASLRAASHQAVHDAPIIAATPSAPEVRMKLPTIPLYNGYVVLKPFTYPAGLDGQGRATFIVPSGVPLPSGSPGQSAVYDMNPGGSVPLCETIECGPLTGPRVGQRVPAAP